MIKIVPLITEYLKIRLKDYNELYLINYNHLTSEKFLLQIYELVDEQKQKVPIHFQLNPEPASVVLKIGYETITLPIDCIRWRLWKSFIVRSRQSSLSNWHILSFGKKGKAPRNGKGEIRISDVITGILTFYNEREEAEAIEVSKGILAVLSPEDIRGFYD